MEISLGRSAELDQIMSVIGKTTVEELLSDLFSGRRTRLVVEALTPGISGSFVLLVKPEGQGAEKPCVVKVGPSDDIKRELEAYGEYVEPFQEPAFRRLG